MCFQDLFKSSEGDENAEEAVVNHHKEVDEVTVDEMTVDEITLDEMTVDEMTVDKMTVDEMTVDDIIKFYEDESNLFTDKDVKKYCGIAHEEVATEPNENVTTKAKTMKPQKIVLTKSTKKKPKIKPTK